jgi:Zn finger protein HypA/HybF involved in hydrogenase expression
MANRRKWTDEDLIEAVKVCYTIDGIIRELGLSLTGGNRKTIKTYIKNLNLDTSHFKRRMYNAGQPRPNARPHNKLTLDEILVKGSNYSSHKLRLRLIKEGIMENKCSKCGISEWLGQPITCHLDHIDGDNTNNELENLRILCPNCHSQTDTYGSKNLLNKNKK